MVYKCQSSDSLPLFLCIFRGKRAVIRLMQENDMDQFTIRFEKLLLSELRLAAYTPASEDSSQLTDEKLAQAVTVNEELINLGFTLKPKDLIALAGRSCFSGWR